MARHTRRRNRIVKPFRGQLYDMVIKNFAYVAIPDSLGRPVKDKKGKIKRSRRKEVTDTFEIYWNLCLTDEYFKMLYERQLKGELVESTLERDFIRSWKYLLRRFATKAPKGMREKALKVEKRISAIDKEINEGLQLLSAKEDFNLVSVKLKKATITPDFKRLIEFYAEYLKDTFTMLGMNVAFTVKNNPKFNIRYVQFSEGDEISEMISKSSAVISGKIEKATKLKKLRDAKLKSSLLKEGYHVETQPYFVKDKGMAYLTVAYDARATQVPKPRSKPNPPQFRQREYDLIVNLESLVKLENVYSGDIDPKELFKAPKCSIQYDGDGEPSLVYEEGEKAKNEKIIAFIKESRKKAHEFSIPEYKEGYGLKPNGEPEAGYYSGNHVLAGKPHLLYKVPKTKLKKYEQAVKVFTKLLQLRTICENLSSHSKEVYDYKQTLKPFIKGVYSNEFTDELGTSYIRFNNMKKLAEKVIEKRDARSAMKSAEPKISSKTIVLEDYPTVVGNKIVYGKRKVQIAEFKYAGGVKYTPTHYKELLKEALQRISLGRSRESLTPDQEKRVLTPKFREIKGVSGITKTLQLCTLKDQDGEDIEIIVSGRYAGYELDAILNMEGRFFEGGYFIKDIQTGESQKVALPRMVFDNEGNVSTTIEKEVAKDQWEYEQRLIEPYISLNPVTKKLVLGIPGSTMGTVDKKIMRNLASKVTTINEKRDSRIKSDRIQGLNPFFTFEPEDFETIRESLGSIAMSATASKFIDEYYEGLRAKENSMTVENTERFTPESLGGFVSETGRGTFKFNNKQREAAAWLEASNMRGVIALDTGVGKTLTALMAIKNAINEEMAQGGKERRFLYVSPKSLVGNLKGEVKAFMVEGGEEFIREDKVKEKVPNWRKIVLSRIDEISYEDFVQRFKGIENIEGELLQLEDGPKLTSEAKRLNREVKHKGEVATITYEIGYKDGKEVWKNEIDFELGNTLDSDSRTASTKPMADDIRISKELVSYPSLNASQEKAKKKVLSETRKSINEHKKQIKIKQFPKVNEFFEKQYHACFFDEINEIFSGKGKASKNYAVSSLAHPRKVFLTASALDRDPLDLYRLATLAKGSIPTKKSERSFAEKYGNVIAGRMVGLKPAKETRTQFYNWVKENAYFSPKMDISVDAKFGVDYEDVGLPSLQELQSRTITTQMSPSIEAEYRAESKKITDVLRAMLYKYRNLKDKLDTLVVTKGDLFDSTKNKVYQDLTLATGEVKKALKELAKISAKVEGKSEVATRLFKENKRSRFLYFCTNKTLARKVAKSNSKADKSSVHALLWDNDITFYQNGKKVAGVKAKDKMSLKDFDNIAPEELWSDIKTANEDEVDPTWAMAISKKYVKNNGTLSTAVCSDRYARGFNFQTFDKVVHLDRGEGFDSELLKQRTARAYRGGQAKRVEEIFIDATFTQESETKGTISDEAKIKYDESLVKSLERRELIRGKSYQEWLWDEDAWIKVGKAWVYPKVKEGEDLTQTMIEIKLNAFFNSQGYIRPGETDEGKPTRRVLLVKGVDPKDLGNLSQDIEMISIDQLKSLVNKADQDFFQDIIYNGLKSDLTARIDGRSSDTGIAIKTPDMLGFVLKPTVENKIRAEKALADYEENPINHISFDPNRYDQSGLWLNDQIVGSPVVLSDSQKQLLDLVGGPTVADYLLGDAQIEISEYRHKIAVSISEPSRFTTHAEVEIRSDYIHNQEVRLKPCAPRGYSPKFLFSQIVVAKRMGKKYLSCEAAGNPGSGKFNGYAVWPKFGFDADINVNSLLNKAGNDNVYAQAIKEIYGEKPGTMRLLKLLTVTADIVSTGYDREELKEYKNAMREWTNRLTTLQRFYGPLFITSKKREDWISQNPQPEKPMKEEIKVEERVAVGEKLWAMYGWELDWCELDLSDGSVGLRIANAYLKKKAFAKNIEVQDFLNSPSDLFCIEDPWCWEQEIDNVKVRGEVMDWRDVVKQYPEAMRSAWYAHQPLREKIETLCGTEREFKSFMRKYKLVDPHTSFKTPHPKKRALEGQVRMEVDEGTTLTHRNVSQRMKLGSQEVLTDKEISNYKLWEETQDPIMLDIWEELRLENYVGRVIAEVIEDDEDVDLIEIQRLRGGK